MTAKKAEEEIPALSPSRNVVKEEGFTMSADSSRSKAFSTRLGDEDTISTTQGKVLSPERQRQMQISKETEELLANYKKRIQVVKEKLQGKDQSYNNTTEIKEINPYHTHRGSEKSLRLERSAAYSTSKMLGDILIGKSPHEWSS